MSSARERFVLAVDDDPAYRSILKLCMRICGFSSVQTASDGREALDYLDYMPFDLIISDWNMTPMDGLELLREVRNTPATAKIPFILMTASLSEFAWREAIDCGATEFLIKPFSLSSLRSACSFSCRVTEVDGTNIVPLRDRMKSQRWEHHSVNSPLTENASFDETGRFRNLKPQVDQLEKTPNNSGEHPSDASQSNW